METGGILYKERETGEMKYEKIVFKKSIADDDLQYQKRNPITNFLQKKKCNFPFLYRHKPFVIVHYV